MDQAQQEQPPKRLPLVLEPENRGSSTSFDAKLVNAFIETKKGPDGKGTGEIWVYERPGTLLASQPSGGAATGRGLFNWKDNIYAIFGSTVYKDNVALAGAIDTTNGVYRFDSSMGGTPRLQFGNGVKAYNYDSGAGIVQITDADFPTSFVKGWSYLDGTTYVMTPDAHVQGSGINDTINWDPLNSILVQIEPDLGVALKKQLVYVVAMKQWTTEVFYDAGNAAGSPLGRVEGAKVNWGCVHADSVRDLGGDLFWAAKTREGGPEVLMMSNLKAETISTKAVERLLAAVNFTTETVFSWTVKLDGHQFYVLTCKNANFTLAYDKDEKMWSQWTDSSGNYLPFVDSCADSQGRQIVQHESNGKLYYMSSSYATDDGSIITVDVVTPNFDGGTRMRKTCHRLEVVGDQVAGSEIMVRHNDFDYDSTRWSNWRKLDMSKRRPFLDGEGSYDRRVYHFRHQKPVRMPRLQAVEMRIELGTI